MRLDEHRHDWPCLAIHLLGSYLESNELGETRIDGPAVVLHGRGGFHAERFDQAGAEALILEFDPAWLGEEGRGIDFARTRVWQGAEVSDRSRALAALWLHRHPSERELQEATAAFLSGALLSEAPSAPQRWLRTAVNCLRENTQLHTAQLARRLDLHPAWLARAYRAGMGEGLRETRRRLRAEQAIAMLRQTDLPFAVVALEAGFCDQSHLNRTLRQLAGRTPAEIRAERDGA